MADAYTTKIYKTLMGDGAGKVVQHLSASASAASAVQMVGPVAFRAFGDFGGGTAYVQALVSGANYSPVVGTSATAADDILIDFPPGAVNTLQVVLSGGAAASADFVLQGYTR